jgi:hypothetical protein
MGQLDWASLLSSTTRIGVTVISVFYPPNVDLLRSDMAFLTALTAALSGDGSDQSNGDFQKNSLKHFGNIR